MGLLDAFKGIFGGNSEVSNTNSVNTTSPDPNANTGVQATSNISGGTPSTVSPFDPQLKDSPVIDPNTPQAAAPPNAPINDQSGNNASTPANNNNQANVTVEAPDAIQESSLPQEEAGNSLDSQGQVNSPAPTTVITSDTAQSSEQKNTSNNSSGQTKTT